MSEWFDTYKIYYFIHVCMELIVILLCKRAAFEKEIEGLPTTRSINDTDIPPELRCPMCKDVMKDAVLTSKCCLKTFCDRCKFGVL